MKNNFAHLQYALTFLIEIVTSSWKGNQNRFELSIDIFTKSYSTKVCVRILLNQVCLKSLRPYLSAKNNVQSLKVILTDCDVTITAHVQIFLWAMIGVLLFLKHVVRLNGVCSWIFCFHAKSPRRKKARQFRSYLNVMSIF